MNRVLPKTEPIYEQKTKAPQVQDEVADCGNSIVGICICECGYSCFPRHLREASAVPPFKCPECNEELIYDEEA